MDTSEQTTFVFICQTFKHTQIIRHFTRKCKNACVIGIYRVIYSNRTQLRSAQL